MKQIITLIIIFISVLSTAQSNILSIEDLPFENQLNSYFKDINNELNTFEGTWLYTNGNTSLKIKLVKYERANQIDYFEDLILGGYQYIENGIEKINKLDHADNLDFLYESTSVIYGNHLYKNCQYLSFDDCIEGQTKLVLSIFDPITNNHSGDLILKKVNFNGEEAIKASIIFSYSGTYPNGIPPEPTLPWQQEYLLIKQ